MADPKTVTCPSCGGAGTVRQAYTAIVGHGGFGLGMAHENVAGYTPVRDIAPLPTYDQAADEAERRNSEMGLTTEDAARIVLSSMRAQNIITGGL